MSIQRCCHVRINGARCTMPAVNGDEFCYHHSTLRTLKRMRPKPTLPKWLSTPLFHLRYPDNYDDLLFNAHLALDAFARHEIDFRQLTTITHQIEMVRKCLAAAERHKKLQGHIEEKEALVTEFRRGEDGELLALPDPGPDPGLAAVDPIPAPPPGPVSGDPNEPSGTAPKIPASAEPEYPYPTNPKDLDNYVERMRLRENARLTTVVPTLAGE